MKASKSLAPTEGKSHATLRLRDAISIIIGIVVGTAIFKSPTLVAQNTGAAWQSMGLWLLGGFLSLLGAFCYAELTTAYPKSGGDYAYLNRAYGRFFGFVFGWGQLTVVLTASIASMAYVFADYAGALWNVDATGTVALAIGSVVVLSIVNAMGVAFGKTAQNVLTVAKISGIVLIAAAALLGHAEESTVAAEHHGGTNIGLAMVFVLYAYGGWNDAAFVAAEVEDGRRNLPRALVSGIVAVTLIYVLVNGVCIVVLGYQELQQTYTPAADVLRAAFGEVGSRLISLIIMVSSLGAMNGTMLTGSRVYAELGKDYRVLRWLGGWNARRVAPVTALATQALVIVLMILAVGTDNGKACIDSVLRTGLLPPIPWESYFGGFEVLVAASAPVFWAFFLLTGVAIFMLRWKDPQIERPFRIPFYPLPAIVFCGMCLYMLYSSAVYAKALSLCACLPLLLGLPLFLIDSLSRRSAN